MSRSVAVPKGYKQTEVGVIPVDWEVSTLAAVMSEIGDGIHATPVYCSFGDYCFINGNNLHDGRIIITEETKRVDHSEYNKHRIHLSDRSILMSINGTIGRLGLYAGEGVILGKSAAYLNVKDGVSKLFVYFSIQTELVKRQFSDGLTGTTIKNLGLATIRNTKIAFPPTKAEQAAIAEALSDADSLIESLEQLIAKKRQIKQGAMQVLLTGKRRLSGFETKLGYKQTEMGEIPEGWELDYIENIAEITTGSRNTQDRVDNGEYPFFVRSQTVEHINSYSFDGEAVLTAGDGVGTGKVFHYINGKFDVHQRVYRISDFSKRINGYFFYLYFSTYFYNRILQMTAKSSVDSVRRDMIAQMLIPFPSTRPEQEAIASILNDMDAEIEALEAKLSKTRGIKQGMMQELLTGKIRLV
jgi:type I restriction enzyme S subunit